MAALESSGTREYGRCPRAALSRCPRRESGRAIDQETDPATAGGTENRPWWTRRSGPALLFVAGSLAGFFLSVFAPVLSDWRISGKQRDLEESIATANQQIEKLNRLSTERVQTLGRQVEISRLLFDHYFGKTPGEQTAVISYLRFQFPADLNKKSLQAILNTAAKGRVRQVITQSVASVQLVREPKLVQATRQERSGFVALINGDLAKACAAFRAAYRAYPTYHNVDEISNRLLTSKRVADFSHASPARREAILRATLADILTSYSWGIPLDLRPRLEERRSKPGPQP